MDVIETRLPGVLVVEPTVYRDSRGFFYESYNCERYAQHGIEVEFVQDNHSRSARNVLRGLHYQALPGQAKLVRVAVGQVLDVVVDVRWGSPTFGQWASVALSADNCRQLFIPVGFAHGFYVLSEVAEFLYKVSSYYCPEAERGIAWDDPDLAIEWPTREPLLSDRDSSHPRLADAPHDYIWQPGVDGA